MLDIEKSSETQIDQDIIFNLVTEGEHEQVLFVMINPQVLKQ